MAARMAGVLVWTACVLASIAAAGQAPDPPRFSTETSAVVLDVVVRDASGHPVTGLRRDDFEVFDGRARQVITVFEGPGARAADAIAAPPDALLAHAGRARWSTRPRDGRLRPRVGAVVRDSA